MEVRSSLPTQHPYFGSHSPPFAGPRGHFCRFSLHVTDSEARRPSHCCFSPGSPDLGVGDWIYSDWNTRGSRTPRRVGNHPESISGLESPSRVLGYLGLRVARPGRGGGEAGRVVPPSLGTKARGRTWPGRAGPLSGVGGRRGGGQGRGAEGGGGGSSSG